MVGRRRRRRPAGRRLAGPSTRARRGGRVHRPVGEHRARRRRRRAGRGLPHVARHPGRPPRPGAPSVDRSRATPRSALRVDPAHRRRTVDVGRRPDRPHAATRARRARRGRASPLVPRAGGLPDHALHRRGRGHATPRWPAAWLTDNRRLDRLAYDPVLVRPAGVPGRKLPPLVPTARRGGRGAGRTWPRTSGSGRGRGGHRHARPPLGGRRRRRRPGATRRTWPSPPRRGSAARVPARRPTPSTDRHRPGHPARLLPGGQQPGDRRAGPRVAPRRAWSARTPAPTLRELTALGRRRRRPGSGGVLFTPWLAGERSPVDDRRARGGFHNLSLADHTGRAGAGGAGRGGLQLAGGCPRPSSASSGAGSRPIRVIGGGASRTCGARSRRRARPARRTGGRAGARQPPRLRPAGRHGARRRGARRDSVRWCPWPPPTTPTPPHDGVMTASSQKFPALYAAQKGMFKRLNRTS